MQISKNIEKKEKTVMVNAKVPESVLEKVNLIREKNNHTLSAIIKASLKTYVEENKHLLPDDKS